MPDIRVKKNKVYIIYKTILYQLYINFNFIAAILALVECPISEYGIKAICKFDANIIIILFMKSYLKKTGFTVLTPLPKKKEKRKWLTTEILFLFDMLIR